MIIKDPSGSKNQWASPKWMSYQKDKHLEFTSIKKDNQIFSVLCKNLSIFSRYFHITFCVTNCQYHNASNIKESTRIITPYLSLLFQSSSPLGFNYNEVTVVPYVPRVTPCLSVPCAWSFSRKSTALATPPWLLSCLSKFPTVFYFSIQISPSLESFLWLLHWKSYPRLS